MREKVARFMVDDDTFSSITFNGNKQVTYLRADGFDSTLGKMDFIIFYNSKGENIVKLYWEADADRIEYTSVFVKNSKKNISLNAICILLYDSITWLRHSAYFEEGIKRLF